MADIEIIRGADNGNPPDTLRQMYPKANRNFQKLNAEIVTNKVDADNKLAEHKNSTSAHSAQNIVYSGDIIGASNVKQALDNTKQVIDDLVLGSGDSGPEVAAARGGHATLGDRLDTSDLQLAENLQLMKNVFVASWHGVDSSIGSADATDALNSLFTSAKTAGKRYVYFDDPHTYNVDGKLDAARDLILIGLAKIKSPVKENFLTKIHNTQNSPNSVRVNSCARTSKTFAQFYQALTENRAIKIAVIGDSISIGGGNQLGVNYTYGGAGKSASPSGITQGDAYTQKLLNEIVTKYKDNTFDFYNFAIGGTSIEQWNTNQTFGGVSKPWVDHVKDAKPDLLLIAFGMNVSYETSSQFRANFDKLMDYISANFTPKPSAIVVTTPRPVNSIEDEWGLAEAQFARINAANAARRRGYKRDCYIMDVGRCSDLVRTGIDWDQMNTYAEAVTDAEFDEAVTSNVTMINGEYALTAVGDSIQTKRIYRDFTLEFDCAFQGSFTTDASNLFLLYNKGVVEKANSALILPVASGGSMSWNFSKYANLSENAATASWAGPALNDNVFRTFRLQKRGSLVELYLNNDRMWAERIETWDIPGLLVLNKPEGAGTIRLKNLKLYRVEYVDFLPTLTEYEMYGRHVDGDYTDKPLIGGNGVNHPASPGLANTYERCIKELIQDLQ